MASWAQNIRRKEIKPREFAYSAIQGKETLDLDNTPLNVTKIVYSGVGQTEHWSDFHTLPRPEPGSMIHASKSPEVSGKKKKKKSRGDSTIPSTIKTPMYKSKI